MPTSSCAAQNLKLEHRSLARTMGARASARGDPRPPVARGEFRDDDTKQHAARVGRTVAIPPKLFCLDEDEVSRLRCAAPLHDIGRSGPRLDPPQEGPARPARVRADEETHAHRRRRSSRAARRTSSSWERRHRAHHHERWDGGGYPHGIAGDEIPLAGRLSAVADVFDALTHQRPYKPAWPVEDAVAEMKRLRGHAVRSRRARRLLVARPHSLLERAAATA